MKKLFLLTTFLALSLVPRSQAQDESLEEEDRKDGKVQYALIMPDEKTPELVKATESSPFGGLVDDKAKDTASGEETKVGDMLRTLPVVGKSSRNTVLLGDIILRRGQLVPPIVPNQTVQLRVNDITPDHIELVWIEKKSTGLPPRTLTIMTDVSPQVKQRLPGNFASGTPGSPDAPVMTVLPSAQSLTAGEPGKPAQKAQPVPDEAPQSTPPASSAPASQTATTGSALLNLFFGSQVKDSAKPGAPKSAEPEAAKPNDEAKP